MERITLRFPDELKKLFQAIKKSAQKNHRSLNSEILRAIEFYLENTKEVTETKSQ